MAYLTKMTTRIFHLPNGHFERKKRSPLSSLMFDTLLVARAKETTVIPFGPGDAKGSFISQITRALIIPKDIITDYMAGFGCGNSNI